MYILQSIITLVCFFWTAIAAAAVVRVGSDVLFEDPKYRSLCNNQKIGIITNHTAVDAAMMSTAQKLINRSHELNCQIKAFFAPEHGFSGSGYAYCDVDNSMHKQSIPIYGLFGKTDRPNDEMLNDITTLIFDIQDIGSRSYTYCTTLYYAMEEAAKRGIQVIVLDRPNPINGITIDGPMLDEDCRSKMGYINVPYCHGMTIGELALFFNSTYNVGCKLQVVPMQGWKREMTFADTGLPWIPTSPQIPEATTPLFYPATGIMGELSLINIGVGYTLPFKLVGAPWIDADKFAAALNQQKFPGVYFEPFHYRPYFGKFAKEDCHGVLMIVTDTKSYLPVTTQYLLIGIIKGLYPQQFQEALHRTNLKRLMFNKANGTNAIFEIISRNEPVVWPLKAFQQKERDAFREQRKRYLLY